MTPANFITVTTVAVEKFMKDENLPLEVVNALVNIQKEILNIANITNEKLKGELPSEIVKRISTTPLFDINGSKCLPDDISLSGHDISVWYCDPGNWMQDEDDEQEVLTPASIAIIKRFFESLSPKIKNIHIEDYHLADVKISMNIE